MEKLDDPKPTLSDRIGAILVIAAKPRIQSSVRSALTAKYGRVLTAETVQVIGAALPETSWEQLNREAAEFAARR